RPRIGAADYPGPVDDVRRLDEHARAAMYDAERTAPRNVLVLTAALRELRARRAELARHLGLALGATAHAGSGQLTADYGPRIDPAARRTRGVRARPRWRRSAEDPQALPAILAADPALRERLACWTLHHACRDAARWAADGIALRLAVELPCPQ